MIRHLTLNNNPKILLCTPINIVKAYCINDWLDCIKNLDYDNYDIFLVDNSPHPAFSEKLKGMGFDCAWEDPKGREARYFMASSNEWCRIKFLAGDYSHMLSIECDIFPPKDIIQKLLAHNKDIVGTTYWTFHGYNAQLQLFTIWNQHTDWINHKKEYKARMLTFEEAQLFMDGSCKPIYANGIGCTLIKRWILEKFKFHIEPDDIGYADSFFHRDLWNNGIENFVDTSIIPLHRNSNWDTVLSDTEHKKMAISRGDMGLKE
jgi:hypothetical protein